MNRIDLLRYGLAFIGIYWRPEPKPARPPAPPRRRRRIPTLPMALKLAPRRLLGFVGIWVGPSHDARPRRSL